MREAQRRVADLDAELVEAEADTSNASEKCRQRICGDIAEAIVPLLQNLPFTYRAILSHTEVADALRDKERERVFDILIMEIARSGDSARGSVGARVAADAAAARALISPDALTRESDDHTRRAAFRLLSRERQAYEHRLKVLRTTLAEDLEKFRHPETRIIDEVSWRLVIKAAASKYRCELFRLDHGAFDRKFMPVHLALRSLSEMITQWSAQKDHGRREMDALKRELLEQAALENQFSELQAKMEDAYHSPSTEVPHWDVTHADMSRALILLAVKHGELGFVLDEAPADHKWLPGQRPGQVPRQGNVPSPTINGEDTQQYSDLMHMLLRRLGGPSFDPMAKLPRGNLKSAAEATNEVLNARQVAGLWTPKRQQQPNDPTDQSRINNLRSIASDHRKSWAAGNWASMSRGFADSYAARITFSDMFAVADRMVSDGAVQT